LSLCLVACGSTSPDDANADATSSADTTECWSTRLHAGRGLAQDLAASMSSVTPGQTGNVELPGTLAVRVGDSDTQFETIEAPLDTGVVVDRMLDGGLCQSEQCVPVTAFMGDRAPGPYGLSRDAQDGARRLFAALVRAREDAGENTRTRTTQEKAVSCTEFTNGSEKTYECRIGLVHSFYPSDGIVFERPICGLIACPTTTLSTNMGVLEDLAAAIDPKYVHGLDIDIPETISGKWHKGTETITTVGGIALRDPAVMAQPKTQVSASFGGKASGDGLKSHGFAAAETLFQKMDRARETHSPFSTSTVRTSPNGRVVCVQGGGSAWYSCSLTDVHDFQSSEIPGSASTVCAASPN
jgi:hypothetical protein